MGFGYTPIHTMQASNGTSTAISRSERSASFSFTLLSSGLKITRCSAGSRYIAATTTPAVAMVAGRGYVRNVPSSTRNSPTKPFVAGSPMDDSETIVSTAASIGTVLAIPPNASIRRECRRSYSIPARKNSPPVEMPWLIITRRAPWTPWIVKAQMPSLWEPAMDREHRNLDREREEERAEQPECDGPESADVRRQVRVRKRVHTGALAHEVHECEDRHQHEQRAEEGVQEELDGRVDAALPAPHSDDEVHRNEHHLPHHVEQEKIEGHEYPDHPRRHDERGP